MLQQGAGGPHPPRQGGQPPVGGQGDPAEVGEGQEGEGGHGGQQRHVGSLQHLIHHTSVKLSISNNNILKREAMGKEARYYCPQSLLFVSYFVGDVEVLVEILITNAGLTHAITSAQCFTNQSFC